MIIKYKKLFIIIIFIILFFYFYLDKITVNIETINVINTNSSSSTIVTPILDSKIELNNNIIYCSTAQLAWNSLYNDLIKETIEIENQPWYVNKLNNLVNLPPQISNDSYIALAGLGSDNIIQKINNELNKKFKNHTKIEFPNINDNDLITFSYLQKILNFKEKFDTFYSEMTFNEVHSSIKSFGFIDLITNENNKKLKAQVKLLHYSKGDFIIELISDSNSDRIILSTLKPESTLLETYNKIASLINSHINPKIRNTGYDSYMIDTLKIPKINFSIKHEFKELMNKRFKNEKYNEFYFANAIQHIKFKLNESGAKLESYSFFRMERSSAMSTLIVKGPFTLIFLSKEAIYPYFMVYFGNSELFERKQNLLELLLNRLQTNE